MTLHKTKIVSNLRRLVVIRILVQFESNVDSVNEMSTQTHTHTNTHTDLEANATMEIGIESKDMKRDNKEVVLRMILQHKYYLWSLIPMNSWARLHQNTFGKWLFSLLPPLNMESKTTALPFSPKSVFIGTNWSFLFQCHMTYLIMIDNFCFNFFPLYVVCLWPCVSVCSVEFSDNDFHFVSDR